MGRLTTAQEWRSDRAREVAERRAGMTAAMADRPGGFEVLTCGGFFAWVRHPFTDRSTADVVRELVVAHDVLVIPGTAFLPDDRRTMRVSVGNLDQHAVADLADRLAAMGRRQPVRG